MGTAFVTFLPASAYTARLGGLSSTFCQTVVRFAAMLSSREASKFRSSIRLKPIQ
jgi:hypothetical protein